MNRRRLLSILVHPVSGRGFLRRSAPVWLGLIVTVGSAIPPATGDVVPWLPTLPEISIADAGYPCSSHSGEWPTFTGFLSNSSAGQLSETTTGDVYGRAQNVDARWQPTPGCGAYRYDGVVWATTNATDPLTVDWGELSGDGQPCNYTVGTADYIHENNGACPSAGTARQVTHLTPEWTYQNDSALDTKGDFAFVHSDCTTDYGADRHWEAATIAGTTGRPGNNCGDKAIDGTNTLQTLVVDGTAPTVAITLPAAGGPALVPSAFYTVKFDATDAVAKFGGGDVWSLQRKIASWTGSCGSFTNDGSPTTGITSGTGQLVGQSLQLGKCYQWVLSATDQNGNPATPVTSGSIRTDTSGVLGDQPQFRTEAWDLGGGDEVAVSVGSGNVRVTHPIVSLPIRGGTFSLITSYNSHDGGSIGMGPGWRLNVQRRLTVNADNSVTFTDADGSRHTFTGPTGSPTVSYTRPATLYATLTRDTAATPDRFTLAYRDQSVDVFDEDITGTGLLKQVKDRFGNTVSIAYSAGTAKISTITDPASRTITFTWTGTNLTSIVDWANVSGGVVQTSGSGNRTHRFFYDGSNNLTGWADPLNTTGTCAPSASHITCLTNTSGLLTAIAKTQTYETISANPGTLGTSSRVITTTIAYTFADVASVTDAENAQTTFSHPLSGGTKVVRPGTPASETTYALVSATDANGRIASVKRKLASAQIETLTTYDSTYPIEPASVTEDNGGTLQRTTNYTYQGSSLALLARIDEPLDGTYRRYIDFTYNANNDVTQKIVSRQADATLRTTTRYCYTTSGCSTSATDLVLRSMIDNYVDGTAGGANGHVDDVTTTFTYDAYGERTRSTRSNYAAGGTLLDSAATGWTYDTYGNLTAEIRNYANGTVSPTGDDVTPNGTTNARTDITSVYTHDTAGNRVTYADARRAIELAKGTALASDDFVSRTTFDALNQPIVNRLPTTPGQPDCSGPPGCRESTMVYDELGLVREAADINDLVLATKYDKAGRALEAYESTSYPAAAVTSTNTYDAQGRLLTAKDRRQVLTSALGYSAYVYDELGRTTDLTEAFGSSPDLASITHTTYDNLDRQASEETAYGVGSGTGAGQKTTWTYDIGGRVTKIDDEFTCATSTFDYRNLETQVAEGLDPGTCAGTLQREITNSYDGLGREINSAITSGDGNGDVIEAASYDGAGRQLSTSATRGTAVTSSVFTLNPLDEIVVEIRSENGSPISWAKTNTDAVGNATDRCVWNTNPDNPAPEPCKAVGQTFTTPPAVHSTTAYDAKNNRISLSIPGAGETTYDALNNYQVDVVYVPTKLNGTNQVVAEHKSDYGYDTRHRLTTINQSTCPVNPNAADPHACTATAIPTGSDTYAYDDNNNRTQTSESRDGGTPTTTYFCYDALNRLVSSRSTSGCSTGLVESYSYDDAGNRTNASLSSPQYFRYSSAGQLCEQNTSSGSCPGDPNTWQIRYDDAGRTRLWNGWTLTYDGEGRLSSACKVAGCATGDMVTMRYDGEGRRVELVSRPNGGSSTTWTFRYQGDAVAQELVGTGTPTVNRTFVTDDAGAIVKFCDPDCSGTNPQYLVTWNGHGDALGIWRVSSADGTLTLANSFTYSTWGQPSVSTHNGYADLGFRYLYVGRYGGAWDSALGIGLVQLGARHYSPALGRFLQPDPSAADANLYSYAGNSPISRHDAAGTCVRTLPGADPWAQALNGLGCVLEGVGTGVKTIGGVGVFILTLPLTIAGDTPQTQTREGTRTIVRPFPRGEGPKGCFAIGEGQLYVAAWALRHQPPCDLMWNLPRRLPRSVKMFVNAVWMRLEMAQKKTLYDLGPDGRGSPYYAMETAISLSYTPKVYVGRVGGAQR